MAIELKVQYDPQVIRANVESHPRMRELRRVMEERYGASEGNARGFAEDLLARSVERFGKKYIDTMLERMTHMFELREQAANVLERVIGSEELSPDQAGAQLKDLYAGIKSDMEAITDPGTFAKKSPLAEDLDLPDNFDKAFAEYEGESPKALDEGSPTGIHVEMVNVLEGKFDRLGKPKRMAMRSAADFAPLELWRAVSSETEGGLDRNIKTLKAQASAHGMSARELEALEQGVRDLSLERARSQRLPETAEGVLRVEGLNRLDPSLRALVEGDRGLELLAAENPRMLAELAQSSGAKSKSALRRYVRQRMVTHIRGLLGEFTTAFDLGDRLVFLKGPDYDVTIPGTDLVGVTKDGKVWLIDNKAMSQAELNSVGSLTRNVAKNIADDTAAFTGKFGLGEDVVIGDAVARLDKATQAIAELTKGMSKDQVGLQSTQEDIDGICKANGIERYVTNAGGKITGLSEGLRRAGILFENLNEPVDPTAPGTGARHFDLP
jgi:hypothetical protein